MTLRWLRRLAAALALLAAAAAGAILFAMRASLPVLDGVVEAAGADAEIEILRDAHGIPHINAQSERDAWFGLGFVHGQDRLYQIAFSRLLGRGELASVLGTRSIGADRYFRTLGLHHVAERNAAALPRDAQQLMNAYAAGINAALAAQTWLPPELLALRHRPPPWTPADSVLMVKLMALRLSGNATEEALRAEMKAVLEPEQFAAAWPGGGPPPPGSNNWVIGPERAVGGAPILANDPHLGLSAPAAWYLAHLRAPGLNVAGATIPGIPAIVVGRNDDAAWGVTNTGPDVQDLFIVADGEEETSRTEILQVRGGTPILHKVHETRYGPVVSNLAPFAGSRRMALSWTAFADDDTTAAAGFALARAGSVDDLFRALQGFHVPMQNFVLADRAGNIGFVAAGRVPVRRAHDGWLPAVPGGAGDWTGVIPFDALPQLRNPPSGLIVTANQDITPPDYAHFISRDWPEDYRARRIAESLAASHRLDADNFAALQTDIVSLMAREFLPLMLPAIADSPWHERLSAWDRRMSVDDSEPLVFQAWFRALTHRLIGRNLPAFRGRYGGRRPAMVRHVLTRAPSWCGPPEDDCRTMLAQAFEDGLAWIREHHGADTDSWRWGEAHKAVSRHLLSDSIPVVRELFAIEREHGGGPYTVMQANTRIDNESAPFAETHGAGLRAIFDLSDADGTRAVIHTGQSGHPLSHHYADLADLWALGGHIVLVMSEEAVQEAAENTLRLIPRPAD